MRRDRPALIFRGYDHVQRVLDGPVGAELSKEMEAVGFKVLGYLYSWGYRNVATAKKEIKTVADLKGLKIRTIPTPVFVGAVNAMGASATPMNFGEVYTSLQSGVLDGYEHTATTTHASSSSIAKYYALTQHLLDPTVVAFSLSEWNKLDDKEKAVVQEGAKLATDIARAMSPVRDAEGMAELQKRGMIITRPDMTEARKAAESVQRDLASKLKADDLLKQILDTVSMASPSNPAGAPAGSLFTNRTRGAAASDVAASGRDVVGNEHEIDIRGDRSDHRDAGGGNICRHGDHRRLPGL